MNDVGANELNLERLEHLQRREQCAVQHAFLKWTIENFSLFPKRKEKYCLSPTFKLKGISWNLALHPRVKVFGVNKIALNIIRNINDSGPRIVTVSYRMGLESADGNKVWFIAEEQRVFGKGDSYGFQTSLLEHLEDFLSEGMKMNDDSLSVLCEMYALYSMSVIDNFEWFDPTHFIDLDLCKDMFSIFRMSKSRDVLIKIPKFRVRAHKCVLFARSKTISRLLEGGKSCIELNCTRSCLMTALLFMYSGNFSYLVRNCVFSIGLYELACELRLCQLKLLLVPEKFEHKSKMVEEYCKGSGKLEKFQLLDSLNVKMRKSTTYFNKKLEIIVKICVQHASNSKNYIECHIEVQGLSEALHFVINLYFSNERVSPKKIVRSKFFKNLGYKNSIYNCIFTFSADDVLSCMTENTLYVNFICQKCSIEHLPETALNSYNHETVPCYDKIWLEDLSSDFKMLYETGEMSDITLKIGSKTFKVHRSIIMARSRYFRKVINLDDSKDKIIKILNIDPYVLNLMCI